MSKHLRSARPSTLIVAVLALVLALGGTATAAKLITGKQIKNSSLTGVDVKNSALTGADVKNGTIGTADLSAAAKKATAGAAGPAGPAGPKGDTGTPGAKGDKGGKGDTGAKGADTGAALLGRMNNLATDLTNQYGFVSGSSSAATDQASHEMLSPSIPVKASGFSVRLTATPGVSATRIFALRANGSPVLTCVIPPITLACESDTTATIPASSRIVIQATSNGNALDADALYSLRLTTP